MLEQMGGLHIDLERIRVVEELQVKHVPTPALYYKRILLGTCPGGECGRS